MAARRNSPPMTPEQDQMVLQLMALCVRQERAAECAGVGRGVLTKRRKRDPDFAERMDTARAKAQFGLIAILHKAAAAGDTKSAMWLLERGWPEEWGRPEAPRALVPGTAAATASQQTQDHALWVEAVAMVPGLASQPELVPEPPKEQPA